MTLRPQASVKRVKAELEFDSYKVAAEYYRNCVECLNRKRRRGRKVAVAIFLGIAASVGLAAISGIVRLDRTRLDNLSQTLGERDLLQLSVQDEEEATESSDRPKFTLKNHSSTEEIPENALKVGYEGYGLPLVFCLASYQGALYAGKVVEGVCNFPAVEEGKEGREEDFSLVTSLDGFAWQPNETDATISPLQMGDWPVCRARYNGGKHPGVVNGSHCYISYDSQVRAIEQYEVLIEASRSQPTKCMTASRP